MAKTPVSASEHAATFSHKYRTIALIVVALAFVMDLLDSTIVNVAIPSIQQNLHTSYTVIQWLVAGYSLAFALLLVTGGRMGDVFGYKKLFIIGVTGFTLASLLSGVSVSPGMLVAMRLLQGSMAALMVPQVMSLMQVMYAPSERAGINGLFGGLGGLAASLGPVIGGLLIKLNLFDLHWRPIFLINVPVGIIGIVAAIRYLPDGKSPHPLKLDIIGMLLTILALSLLVFPLIEGRDMNWPVWSYVMMAASLPVAIIFAWWQRVKMDKDGSPLVVPALFRRRSFILGLFVNIIFEAAMLGFFLTFTLILQIGLGFSAIHAALTGLPVAIGIAFTMAAAGQTLVPKIGRYSLTVGTMCMAIGLGVVTWVFHRYGLTVHSWQFIPGLLGVGIGMGFIFAPLFAIVLNDVDPRHAGAASGTLNAVQQVGGAIGIAVIGVIFFGQLSHAAPQSFDNVQPALQTQLAAEHIPAATQTMLIASAKNCYVDRSREKDAGAVPASCRQSTAAQSPQMATVYTSIEKAALTANAQNFSHAFRWGTVYEICLLAVVAALSFLLPRRIRKEAFQEQL